MPETVKLLSSSKKKMPRVSRLTPTARIFRRHVPQG
jgi:hypothetical protein